MVVIAWRIIIAPAMLGIATNLVINPAARADPGIFDDGSCSVSRPFSKVPPPP